MTVDPPTGYTDTLSQEPYNVALSLRRAACAYARTNSDTKSGSPWKRETTPCLIWAQLAYLRQPRRAR